jgi:hypothetical protein
MSRSVAKTTQMKVQGTQSNMNALEHELNAFFTSEQEFQSQ